MPREEIDEREDVAFWERKFGGSGGRDIGVENTINTPVEECGNFNDKVKEVIKELPIVYQRHV